MLKNKYYFKTNKNNDSRTLPLAPCGRGNFSTRENLFSSVRKMVRGSIMFIRFSPLTRNFWHSFLAPKLFPLPQGARGNNSKSINILLILCTSVVLSGCNFNHKIAKTDNNQIILDTKQELNAKIQTELMQIRPVQLKITIPAQFKAMAKYLDTIYNPVDGKVTRVFVQIGDIVKIGQPLVEIKSDIIGQIQLEFLNTYIDVTSQIKQMSAQYNLSYRTYVRGKTLFSEGISSRAEYEVARAEMQKDKANLDSLKIKQAATLNIYAQRVAIYGGNQSSIARVAATGKIYPYITLRANKHGVVLERLVNQGEIINQNKELVNLADLSTIWLVGYAFEKDTPLLHVGQKVTGNFEEQQQRSVKGVLSYVASILEPEKKTMEVIADIPNKDYAIKPNMYAEMVVDTGKMNVLAVPNTALQQYGDYTFAFVKTAPHKYEERKVEVGQSNDNYSEVKSGLNYGEEVVSSGGFSLLGESIKKKEE